MFAPIKTKSPFNCDMLPCASNKNMCDAQLTERPQTAPGSCDRLPFRYQQFCRALPPPDPVYHCQPANEYDPRVWPNTAGVDPVRFAQARESCIAAGPRGFYQCVWNKQ